MRSFKSLALAALAISSLSCTNASKTSGIPDACALLPESAAESILGVQLTQAKSQRFGENPRQTVISNCLLTSKTDELKTLTFTIRVGGAPESSVNPAETQISTMKQEFGQRYDLKKITGLGDGAVWDDSMKQLTVFRGTNTYVWNSPGATAPALEEKFVALAKKTIDRI